MVSVSSAPQQKAKAAENGLKFYLPPSFMPATLLTGVRAGTMQGGQSKEKPLLIRIKDLAVLPNEIKSNLKGCFVIASVQGDLSDERAHARLTNLSCISKTGESVVEAKVKGYVVDADGQIGLAGTVVTRMGALLGRSVLAGFFGGMGEAVENSTKITSVSALGSTQSINPDKIL
ncbi:MAG: TraB/VirB10 family protein, partial [Deltaproteobacteria bacterium]|nr:TraB/VirB10 family protein [Deltaproteobacteria bacterium]